MCYALRALVCEFFAALRFPSLAQKQTSSVIRKQHLEVVFFPPAPDTSRVVSSLHRPIKKLPARGSFFIGGQGGDRLVLCTSGTRLRIFRRASVSLACSKANIVRHQKTTFRGCFLSSSPRHFSCREFSPPTNKKTPCKRELFYWWSGRGSNPRHEDFQSSALPTELPDHRVRETL